jgi:hypothetical protein
MRILFTVHLDGDFRAGDGAQRTARALAVSDKDHGPVTFGIVILCRLDLFLLAGVNAEVAFLAAFEVDGDAAFFQRGFHSFLKIRRVLKPARPFLRKTSGMSSIKFYAIPSLQMIFGVVLFSAFRFILSEILLRLSEMAARPESDKLPEVNITD